MLPLLSFGDCIPCILALSTLSLTVGEDLHVFGGYFSLPYRVGGMSDRWEGGFFSRIVMPPLLVFAEECPST